MVREGCRPLVYTWHKGKKQSKQQKKNIICSVISILMPKRVFCGSQCLLFWGKWVQMVLWVVKLADACTRQSQFHQFDYWDACSGQILFWGILNPQSFFPSVHFFGLFATGNSLITRPSDYFGEGRVAFPEGRKGRSNTDSGDGWWIKGFPKSPPPTPTPQRRSDGRD